jgi:DNA-binding XRE family transcriptional regulator
MMPKGVEHIFERREVMQTRDYRETYANLPQSVKPAILALSVLIERIGSLPKPDRDDLFELLQEWRKADNVEEQESIHHAMEEVLAQVPATTRPFFPNEEEPLSRGLKRWAEHVGQKIRDIRTQAGFTQSDLASRAGLPQSHISRLENAEHSATHLTLEKIANALGVPVGEIDPSAD